MTSSTTSTLSRRRLLAATGAALLGAPAFAQGAKRELRIGHQKGYLSLLKGRGTLERRLAPLGVKLGWTEFTAGPVQLEALNVGAIDFGDVGEAPPIFAQAAGAPLAYVAASVPRPASEAVLVPAHSPIRSVGELKGKRVAFNKGSNVHYFIVKLFEKHGLAYGDLNPLYLPPADARAAFEKGAIDAWVIWDPFLAAAQKTLDARLLADAEGVVVNRSYYFSSLPYAERNADIVQVLVEEIDKVDQWGKDNRAALSAELSTLWGLPRDVVDLSTGRTRFGTGPITRAILAQQQEIADTFFALKLIPRRVDVLKAAVQGIA